MKYINIFILLWITSVSISAQSFYVLTGVKAYDPIVANMSTRVDKSFDAEIRTSMREISKELGVDTSKRLSRVLAVVLTDVSIGSTISVKIELSLGEYVRRQESSDEVFALTYQEVRFVEVIKEQEELEEQLTDAIDEMLEKFVLQYKEDNKKISTDTKSVPHEDFATKMVYETDYQKALAKAKKEKKQVMLFMTTNFCPWCRKMESRILSKADIDAKMKKKLVPLMLNFSEGKFPDKFKKNALTPTLYIINPNNEEVLEAFIGYSSREEFLQFIK